MLIRCGVGSLMDIAGLPMDLLPPLRFAIDSCFLSDSFSSSSVAIWSLNFLCSASSCLALPNNSFCCPILARKPVISSLAFPN